MRQERFQALLDLNRIGRHDAVVERRHSRVGKPFFNGLCAEFRKMTTQAVVTTQAG